MNTEQNSEQILDQTIAGIRAEEMDPADVQQAAARVWSEVSRRKRRFRDDAVFSAPVTTFAR